MELVNGGANAFSSPNLKYKIESDSIQCRQNIHYSWVNNTLKDERGKWH
jgi:hypothetical protein